MTAFVFPGQGSQFIGMAKDFNDNFQVARSTFEEIEDYSKIDVRNIIFNNVDNKLDLTQFTQICIFASSYAIFRTYISESDFDFKNVKVMLGHSLGEYTALACSKKINLYDCTLILKKRGELMNSAVAPNKTGMAALIGKDANYIQSVIDENKLNIEIANDNSPMQIVISGNKNDLSKCKSVFLENKIKKFIELNVSAGFHSKFMLDAEVILSSEIDKVNFEENDIKIISNYNFELSSDISKIKKNLKKQMSNKVNWTQSVKKLEEIGEKKILEIGPNKVLSGLINRISRNFDITSITQISDL